LAASSVATLLTTSSMARLNACDVVIGHLGERPGNLVQRQFDRDEFLDVVERRRIGGKVDRFSSIEPVRLAGWR
jgi:hypothetical protein